MKTVVLDFESFYSKDYSLRKITPVEYILDPRYEFFGVAVKVDGGASVWMEEAMFREFLKLLPKKVMIISHNALFDMSLLAWRFGYVPYLMVDTLGMARAWLGHALRSLSLSSVATYLKLGFKGDAIHKVIGMSLAALKQSGFYKEFIEYALTDADLCWGIYQALTAQGFPAAELAVMDTVIRACVMPRFQLDQTLLAEHKHNVAQEKAALMLQLPDGVGRDELMSNDKFAEALRSVGVEPPMKTSLRTGQQTYAFAKSDPDFIELEEHDDPRVQALVCARLGIKSTLEETRTNRLISISNLFWGGKQARLLPVPLRYSGAHTHRLSGDWKLNLQNLRRGGKLRYSIKAPKGMVVVAEDSSQVEARLAGWFCGASALTNAFAAKQDVYSIFASNVFGYPVAKSTHPVERFIGKTAVLGLQYGLGVAKFLVTTAVQSKAQVGKEVILTEIEGAKVVSTYRSVYSEIPRMWRRLNSALPRLLTGTNETIGPITLLDKRILLPNGLYLNYHNLKVEDGDWSYTFGGKMKRLYGGAMLENIIQALARCIVMDTAVRMRQIIAKRFSRNGKPRVWLNLQVHDELVYVVPEDIAVEFQAVLHEEMLRRPWWGPDIPLDAEGSFGESYGDAK